MSNLISHCESIHLTTGGVVVQGWAADEDRPGATASLEVRINGAPVDVEIERSARPDVAKALNIADHAYGFRILLPPESIFKSVTNNISVICSIGESRVDSIIKQSANEVALLDFSSKDDFLTRFQNPAFRTGNALHLVYGAAKAIRNFPDDKNLAAAAYCVLLYRVRDYPELINAMNICEDAAVFSASFVDDGSPVFARWKISLLTALGCYWVSRGRLHEAFVFFAKILNIPAAESRWPQMLTNVLCARVFCGWHLLRHGKADEAVKVVADYSTVYRNAIQRIEFQNWYVFEELNNASNAAQQCAVILAIASGTAPSEFVVPEQHRRVNFSRLYATWKWLVEVCPELNEA